MFGIGPKWMGDWYVFSDDRMNGHFRESDPDRHEQERALIS